MEKQKGVYCIENKINGKKYIGSSQNILKRKRSHFRALENNKHKNIKLQLSYNKHKKDDFIFYIIEKVENKNDLIRREQFYIDSLKPVYNINKIANSSLGVKRRKETVEKIRIANLGLKHPVWRNEIKSKSQGGDNHWTKKKKFSKESKKKMSESQKKLYSNGYKSPVIKPIIQCSLEGGFIKRWESSAEVERILGFSRSSLCQCLKGHNKTSNGFKWKYDIN